MPECSNEKCKKKISKEENVECMGFCEQCYAAYREGRSDGYEKAYEDLMER